MPGPGIASAGQARKERVCANDPYREDWEPAHEYQQDQLKRCTGCKDAWYCSVQCQKEDWGYHKFTCRPDAVTTAEMLARDVRRDLLPTDPQTREDYGFDRVPEEPHMLFGLYVGLINYLNVTPKMLHNWLKQGVLANEIKKLYEEIPPNNRGGYYPWFLRHEHELQLGSATPAELTVHQAEDLVNKMRKRAWVHIGGSPDATVQTINQEIQAMSEERQGCFTLLAMSLGQSHPSPSMSIWVTFGFCLCNQYSEMRLGTAYQRLLQVSNFEEFVTAYTTSSMAAFFKTHSNSYPESPDFERFMATSPRGPILSVWWMKAFVFDVDKTPDQCPHPAVMVDYGFANCKSQEETNLLHDVYKIYLEKEGSAWDLHEACIKGGDAMYACVTAKVNDKATKRKAKTLKRLMKNPYPLIDPRSTSASPLQICA